MLNILKIDSRQDKLIIKYTLNGILKMKILKDFEALDRFKEQHKEEE